MDLTAVPFTITTIFFGIKTVKGVVLVRNGNLILKFNTSEKDKFSDHYRGELTEEMIPVEELETIEWERGWFQAVIIITVASGKLAACVPGSAKGKIKLNIGRPFRSDAERLIARLRLLNPELDLTGSARDYQQLE